MFNARQQFQAACLLLALTLMWFVLGSPVTGPQWQALPSQFRMAAAQLPLRLERILRNWPSAGQPVFADASVTVFDPEIQALRSLPMTEYLTGCVAAEMPASYHLEALKCQAVAARTFHASRSPGYGGSGCPSHPGAELCLDPACCQGYQSPELRKARWGSDWPAYEGRISQAVEAAGDWILTWEGQPIQALYHAVSGGQTEAAALVFSQDVSYLVSVPSPGEEGNPRFETQTRLSCEEAARLLNAAFPQADLSPDLLAAQLALREVSPTGRALTVQVGNELVTGRQFRQALDLNSTLITLQCDGAVLTITQRGYGHGVGMSQAGANAMAARGCSMAGILSHYYPETVLTSLYNGSPAGAS